MMPDHSKPFQIQVDSLLFATGGILSQMDTNGDRQPCAYLSKSLMKEQRNYDIGTTGNRMGSKEMETLYSRIWTYNDCPI
jgi:hypothetical protein